MCIAKPASSLWASVLFSILLLMLILFWPLPFGWVLARSLVNIYMRLLRFLSLPILFFSILSTSSALWGSSERRSWFHGVVFWSVLTTVLAAVMAMLACVLLHPQGTPLALDPAAVLHEPMEWVPDNIVHIFLAQNVLAVVGLGFLLGYASGHLPNEERLTLERLARALFGVFLFLARQLIAWLPYISWAFVLEISAVFFEHVHALSVLLGYVMTVLLANTLQAFVVLPILLMIFGRSPLRMLRDSFSALSLAFLSKSSAATLPESMRVCTDRLGLHPEFATMALPLCTTINMNGCAAFIYATVYFVSASQGAVWSVWEYFFWIALSVIAALGNAGVPMGCYFMASAFLGLLNMPLDWMSLIFPFYLLLDMYETAINVWSDLCVVTIVGDQNPPLEKS